MSTTEGGASMDVRERLAAKRQELARGSRPAPAGNSRERLAALRRSVSKGGRPAPPVERRPAEPKPSPPPAAEPPMATEAPRAEEPGKPAKAPIPSHLSRRERLRRACYRDTFNITNLAVVPHMPKGWQAFCPCMLDAIFSTGVSASHQEALIEDFKENRSMVDAANPAFEREWKSRCPM